MVAAPIFAIGMPTRASEKMGRAHGVHIRNRVGSGDAPEIIRIIDDGHEKVSRRDDRSVIADAPDGRIIAGGRINQKIDRRKARRRSGQ
ncbi:MAG: hypothetical protein R3C42_07560 [Parvularculaceae bacterium]